MEAGFAQDHRIAAVAPGGGEQLAGRAAGHGHRADRLVGLTHHLQPSPERNVFSRAASSASASGSASQPIGPSPGPQRAAPTARCPAAPSRRPDAG